MSEDVKLPDINEQRRIAVLLADRAVQPLHDDENDELQTLLARHPAVDDSELDEAAAALHLSKPVLPESLPAGLRARLFADAALFFAAPESVPDTAPMVAVPVTQEIATEPLSQPDLSPITQPVFAPAVSEPLSPAQAQPASPAQTAEVVAFPLSSRQPSRAGTNETKPKTNWISRVGWLAAAACLVLAFGGWWKVREQRRQIAALTATKAAPDYAALRQALIAKGGQLVKLDWTAATYPGMQKVKGDVVWSDADQRGYMRFVGMPANDPDRLVYQLWIFAANQEETYPIDGGVFNITSNGEVIVPIHAKLLVNQPGLFAVTIEKPGGVVVSKRDKLALLAKVG